MVKAATASSIHLIDLSTITSQGFDRNDDINTLLASVPPVDLQGRDATTHLPVNRDELGFIDEVGIGPKGYRDCISNVFKMDAQIHAPSQATEYISTFGVPSYGIIKTSKGPEDTKGYVMQLAVLDGYRELFILPHNRALAEALHHAAVNYYRNGSSIDQIEQGTRELAGRLGVQVIS